MQQGPHGLHSVGLHLGSTLPPLHLSCHLCWKVEFARNEGALIRSPEYHVHWMWWEEAGWAQKGAGVAVGRKLGSANGWKGRGGKPGGARLSHDKRGDVWTAIKADRKSRTSSRNTLCTKTSLERSAGNRSLPGAWARLACPAEFLGPSYLITTPKINFRDTSPCKKVGSSRGASRGEKHGTFFHSPGLHFEMRGECWEDKLQPLRPALGSERNKEGLERPVWDPRAPVRGEGPPMGSDSLRPHWGTQLVQRRHLLKDRGV